MVVVLVGVMFVGSWAVVKADDCENPSSLSDFSVISGCISKLGGIMDAISKANSTNQQQLKELQGQITNLQANIANLSSQLDKLGQEVFDREVQVGVRKALLAARVERNYKMKRDQSVLTVLLSSDTAESFFRDLAYREKIARDDQQAIASVSAEIANLNDQATNLKNQQNSLAVLKDRVNKQADFLAGEVAKASAYVATLGSQISALSQRQQDLLAEKTGTFATSVGDVPPADDPNARPDYNPGFSPAFAVFSFGAPHFKGMSQYGAFGRAKSGQSAEDILHAYYGGGIEINKGYSTGINIAVQGYGSYNIEDYVKRIYEMPSSWGDQGGMEALKAQAVAARSYALASTNNGSGSICASEACQVFKPQDKGGNWDAAVDATRGWVLQAGGKPYSAWYAASSGGYQQAYSYNGYSTPGFWDTTSDWTHWADGAWEVKGGSPWFYKGWYRSRSGVDCGRSHPWLSQDEFSDIVNAALVYANGGDTSGLYPTDSCLGQAGWARDRMASEADKYGGRVTSVSSFQVIHSQGGYTDKVIFETNRGEVTISGGNFYNAFNLRAPGAISVKSELFNIEKK